MEEERGQPKPAQGPPLHAPSQGIPVCACPKAHSHCVQHLRPSGGARESWENLPTPGAGWPDTPAAHIPPVHGTPCSPRAPRLACSPTHSSSWQGPGNQSKTPSPRHCRPSPKEDRDSHHKAPVSVHADHWPGPQGLPRHCGVGRNDPQGQLLYGSRPVHAGGKLGRDGRAIIWAGPGGPP